MPPVISRYVSGVAGPTGGYYNSGIYDSGPSASTYVRTPIAPQRAYGPNLAPTEEERSAPRMSYLAPGVNKQRPYADVGKMTVNLADPTTGLRVTENNPEQPGMVEGFASAVGRGIGGFISEDAANTGGDIGAAIGGVVDVPLGWAGNILGALPATPLLPGFTAAGSKVAALPEEERKRIEEEIRAEAGWNPLKMLKGLQEADRSAWDKKVETGEINPLLADLGPTQSLGDQVMHILGLTQKPEMLVQRTVAGASGRAENILDEADEKLNPQLAALRDQYQAGLITRDQFLDHLVVSNAGYTSDWAANLGLSLILDPLNLLAGVGALGKAAAGSKVARAVNFTKALSPDDYVRLVDATRLRLADEGVDLANLTDVGRVNREVLKTADELGMHQDKIKAINEGISARRKFVETIGGPLEPVWKVAEAISEPFSLIGRRGTTPMANAWLSASATEAVAHGYGVDNFARIQTGLAQMSPGAKDKFDEAVGYFTAQQGYNHEAQMLGRDVVAAQAVSEVTPTQVVQARMATLGSENYGQQLEKFVLMNKTDVVMASGKGTLEANRAAAVQDTIAKLRAITGIGVDEAAQIVAKLDDDGLSLVHAAYYGQKIKAFNSTMGRATRLMQQVLAANPTSIKFQKAAEYLERLTIIGPGEITTGRARRLRVLIASAEKGDANALAEVRLRIKQYDATRLALLADEPDGANLLAGITKWLDENEAALTAELTDEVRNMFPASIQRVLKDENDGYIWGLAPDEDGLWRASFDESDQITVAKPWIGLVRDKANPWTVDDFGSDMLGTLGRWKAKYTRRITTSKIVMEARRDFIGRLMDGFYISMDSGISYKAGRELWDAVSKAAETQRITPRGLDLRAFEEIIEKSDEAKAAGLSGRDLMMATLGAYQGRVGTVGVTQAISGAIKTKSGRTTENAVGRMAEALYPNIRFRFNPFFQMQEWLEPWVFAASRERRPIYSGAKEWIDKATGELMAPDELARLQQSLVTRYMAENPGAQLDALERGFAYMAGNKAAKEAMSMWSPEDFEEARRFAVYGIPGMPNVARRKRAHMSTQWRAFAGPMLKERFDAIDPAIWPDLERWAGTSDTGEIAVRWMIEKDMWASADPNIAKHILAMQQNHTNGALRAVNLDGVATTVFKKDSADALAIGIRSGEIDESLFMQLMDEAGADPLYASRAWIQAEFRAKIGGVDAWWEEAVPVARGGRKEVEHARSIVRALADGFGVSEEEFISRWSRTAPSLISERDLIDMTARERSSWDFLFQSFDEADGSYWDIDPVTGVVTDGRNLDETQRFNKWLRQAQNPPSRIKPEDVGDIKNIERVDFGGRSLYVPGGAKALADPTKPWTIWEAQILRSQMIDPKQLSGAHKAALYEKMWRARTFDMTDQANAFRLFDNYAMAMFSPNTNLTTNELAAHVVRVRSNEELALLADEVRRVEADIMKGTGGTSVSSSDLGMAMSTRMGQGSYFPLDAVDDYINTHAVPEHHAIIRRTADVAGQYLSDKRARHHVHMATAQALADAEAAAAKAAKPKRAPKYTRGPVSEWAIDVVAKHLVDEAARTGKAVSRGLDTAPEHFKVRRWGNLKAAERLEVEEAVARLSSDLDDPVARDTLAKYIKGTKSVDENLILKKYNVNGAGQPGKHDSAPYFGYVKNETVKWRSIGTNNAIGNQMALAKDMVDNPDFFVRRKGPQYEDGLEPLDEFAERIANRTRGLALKTGYFGADLGDPIAFNRGVMDIHMVGDLTEYMYYEVTKKGTTPEWAEFMSRLSPDKQKQINAWIGTTRVELEDKTVLHFPEGAPRGAGVYKWAEATGLDVSFKTTSEKLLPDLIEAQKNGDTAFLANFVRNKINEHPEQFVRDRLLRMYPDDESLAALYDTTIGVFGGDYRVYDELMSSRKAAEGFQHGNGAYQWWLWDDRRHIFDPELATFPAAHEMKPREVGFLSRNNDLHQQAGWKKKVGLGPTDESGLAPGEKTRTPIGESVSDPIKTFLGQRDGPRYRGATVITEAGDRIIKATEYRNASTFIHEVAHTFVEPLLDPSGVSVIRHDLNRVIAARNDALRASMLKTEDALEATKVTAAESATKATAAQTAAKEARAAARTATNDLSKATEAITDADLAIAKHDGVLAQMKREAPAKRRLIESRSGPAGAPSKKAAAIERLDGSIKAAEDKAAALRAKRAEAVTALDTAKAKHAAALDEAKRLGDESDAITAQAKADAATEARLTKEFNDLSTKEFESLAYDGDARISEHLAEEFEKWLATGKAPNPQMRDAFAYFRSVLMKVWKWLKDDVKANKVSPEVEALFKSLVTPPGGKQVAANVVPFNATEEAMHAAAARVVIEAEDAAFTNTHFHRGRTAMERSLNHPYMGIYPSSYMWGKVLPEMIRGLALNPFGIPIPGILPSGTGLPGMGFVNANRVYGSVMQQQETDPEFNEWMEERKDMWRALAMLLPAVPWDVPANFPLWSRRFAEWGHESQARVAEGKEAKDFDVSGTARDMTEYAFGLASTAGWVGDVTGLADWREIRDKGLFKALGVEDDEESKANPRLGPNLAPPLP